MTFHWSLSQLPAADPEPVAGVALPPGLQVHPIQAACAPPNRRLTFSISFVALTTLAAGSIYLSILSQRLSLLAAQVPPRTIALLLYEGGDGQPVGRLATGGGRTQDQVNQPVLDPTLKALSTRLDSTDEPTEPLLPRDDVPDKPMELLNLQPNLLPGLASGTGNGLGTGLGNENGNGLGAGLGRGRGSTWIHSTHGDEDLKVAVSFLDVHDYVPPEYPTAAVFARVSGVVILRVTIDSLGTPVRWDVIEGDPLLVAATLKVFPRWHFIPPVYHGEKVGATFEVGVRFTLR